MHEPIAPRGPASSITGREREVLWLLASGEDYAGVACTLGLSYQTIKNHIATIYRKLGARTVAHAVALGVLAGVLRLDAPPEQGPRPEVRTVPHRSAECRNCGAPRSNGPFTGDRCNTCYTYVRRRGMERPASLWDGQYRRREH